ncbi:hypothetical protein JL720_5411 [Aureococcus anophagefferens]|nr:hypothetical protein JL720_5411 [Aureococcus anophagefferens]
MKEEKVTDYLTRWDESGLRAVYGVDHGPLTNYTSCNTFDDACAVHAADSCGRDSFCRWADGACSRLDDRDAKSLAKLEAKYAARGEAVPAKKRSDRRRRGLEPCGGDRPIPQQLVKRPGKGGDARKTVNDSACALFVHEPAFVKPVAARSVEDDPSAMFYHWWRYFKGLHSSARRGPDGAVDGRSHYLIARAPNTQFFHYFGLLSDNCWRRSDRDVPKNTCFCASEAEAGRDVSGAAGAPSGRDNSPRPVDDDPRGVHGSGLNNAIFMPEGACLIQLLPFGLKYKGSFQANAVAAGVEYREWKLEDSSLSRFHWEFLGEKELRHGKQAVLDRGSPSGGAEVYTFWINQDIVVPVADFVALLEDAILTSPLNRKLYDGAVVEGRNKQEAAARGPRGGDAPRAAAAAAAAAPVLASAAARPRPPSARPAN